MPDGLFVQVDDRTRFVWGYRSPYCQSACTEALNHIGRITHITVLSLTQEAQTYRQISDTKRNVPGI